MTPKGKVTSVSSFLEEVSAMPGGESARLCIQCGTCTGSCPNANRMQYSPRQIIAMVRAGMREEVLSSNSMWYCVSCYLCTTRCPRGIKPTDIMHALECLAVRYDLSHGRSRTPALYGCFANFVYSIGRVPEFGFMAWFYMLTNPLRALSIVPVGLALIKRGRLSIKARMLKGKAAEQLKAILDKAEALGGV